MLSLEAVLPFIETDVGNSNKDTNFSVNHDNNIKTVDRIHKHISYQTFFTNYLCTNKPCIISSWITENWKSKKEWVERDGTPNFCSLKEKFGTSVVPVADCNIKEYNSQMKQNMLFNEYIDYWRKLMNTEDENLPCLYLKDWHFNRQYPDYKPYETPEYFRSDWLNEFCEKESDDYQFVYMGPKGTWTPLHADVFGSYSWSANICGCKRWILFPPGNEKLLEKKMQHIPYEVKDDDLTHLNVFYIEVVQKAGEVIFVPSGWYHQVWNVEDTISVNHNWYNGCNVQHIWQCLNQACIDVEREISDCKGSDGWEEQVQVILKVHHGMNYEDFLCIMKFIFKLRLKSTETSNSKDTYWHDVFDIVSIRNVCMKMLQYQLSSAMAEKIKSLQVLVINYLSNILEKNIYCI